MVHIDLYIPEGQYITFPYLLLRAEALVYTYARTTYKYHYSFRKSHALLILDSPHKKPVLLL